MGRAWGVAEGVSSPRVDWRRAFKDKERLSLGVGWRASSQGRQSRTASKDRERRHGLAAPRLAKRAPRVCDGRVCGRVTRRRVRTPARLRTRVGGRVCTHPQPLVRVKFEHMREQVERVVAKGGRRPAERLARPAREDGLEVWQRRHARARFLSGGACARGYTRGSRLQGEERWGAGRGRLR